VPLTGRAAALAREDGGQLHPVAYSAPAERLRKESRNAVALPRRLEAGMKIPGKQSPHLQKELVFPRRLEAGIKILDLSLTLFSIDKGNEKTMAVMMTSRFMLIKIAKNRRKTPKIKYGCQKETVLLPISLQRIEF
jgi:hypothetical protein